MKLMSVVAYYESVLRCCSSACSGIAVSEFPLLGYTSSSNEHCCCCNFLMARALFHRDIGRPSEICILGLPWSFKRPSVCKDPQKNDSKTRNSTVVLLRRRDISWQTWGGQCVCWCRSLGKDKSQQFINLFFYPQLTESGIPSVWQMILIP